MLRLYKGPAGAGKTREVMKEIKNAVVGQSDGRYILSVPENFSHEADRELCLVCGNQVSLYAEVLSLEYMAKKMLAKDAGAKPMLDQGGRILCMSLALEAVYPKLKVYGTARKNPESQRLLIKELDEIKASCIDVEMLLSAARRCEDALSYKLEDLASIMEAYDTIVENGHLDPADSLSKFADAIPDSEIDASYSIYLDGYSSFTMQELSVIEALMKTGALVTVCLNTEEESDSEIFEMSRITEARLKRRAEHAEVPVEERYFEEIDRSSPLRYYCDNVFTYRTDRQNDNGTISLYSASSLQEECEFAAAKCIQLVEETGCRWRDIGIAVRGFDDYRVVMDSMFSHYDVPLFMSRRTDLFSRSLPALIRGAYEIISSGWDSEEILAFLRTGLAGINQEQIDMLESYVQTWGIQGSAWKADEPWLRHPKGYGKEFSEEIRAELEEIKELKNAVICPLSHFDDSSLAAKDTHHQAMALVEFLEEIDLQHTLQKRAEILRENHHEAIAAEYEQLWGLLLSAIQQMVALLGEVLMDRNLFSKLLLQVLSQYDIGTIPVSLDNVSAGDFDRMRKRHLKHLIILGASEKRLPKYSDEGKIFSDNEIQKLHQIDLELGGPESTWLWREFATIYNTITLPEETLTMTYSVGEDGEPQRPSILINRARGIFGIDINKINIDEVRSYASGPVVELAARSLRDSTPYAAAAGEYLKEKNQDSYSRIMKAHDYKRGELSETSIQQLYGKNIRLSPTRIDRLSGCRFAFFMQFGLRVEKRRPAGITPPEIGTFMHYVLQKTASEVRDKGGFSSVDNDQLYRITEHHIKDYIHEVLGDYSGQTNRFKYLFKRLAQDVHQVVSDMADELKRSKFEPLDFELEFGSDSRIPSIELKGETVRLTGIADRIDGWIHDGKLYIRVIDYKTGTKKFSLSDVWYGMNLQMLLYLYVLQEYGEQIYDKKVIPAGVLYVPAKNVILSSNKDLSDEEIHEKLAGELKRSGLILDDEDVISAMEEGEYPRYIPVKFKSGVPSGDSLASMEHLQDLSRHIQKTLQMLAQEVRSGVIAANPYYRSESDNACKFCDYRGACNFEDLESEDSARYIQPLTAEEVWRRMEEESDGDI